MVNQFLHYFHETILTGKHQSSPPVYLKAERATGYTQTSDGTQVIIITVAIATVLLGNHTDCFVLDNYAQYRI